MLTTVRDLVFPLTTWTLGERIPLTVLNTIDQRSMPVQWELEICTS